jgi:hypothetical protein
MADLAKRWDGRRGSPSLTRETLTVDKQRSGNSRQAGRRVEDLLGFTSVSKGLAIATIF